MSPLFINFLIIEDTYTCDLTGIHFARFAPQIQTQNIVPLSSWRSLEAHYPELPQK